MSRKLEMIINQAIKKANIHKYEYLTLEAMLIAMLDDPSVCAVLEECGGAISDLKEELNNFYNDTQNFSVLNEEQILELGKRQFVDEELRKLAKENGIAFQPEISLAVQRVIQRAAIHVQSSGKKDILGLNLLVALFNEKESFAIYVLQKQGIDRFEIIQAISHGVDGSQNALAVSDEDTGEEASIEGESSQKKTALDEYAVNLNNEAKEGRIDPLIGRKEEMLRVVQILCRRRKNNPILVGEAGVGKTALAEGLALSIVNGDVPEVLEGVTIYALDLAAMLAGAKFRGDFEKRFKGVLKELTRMHENGDENILFIDELHTIMGAGAVSGGSMDASNLLKPSLSSGKVRCMGSTTNSEYRKFIEKDAAFSRRFQKVDIDEPSNDETLQILKGLKSKFEEFHNVKYSNSILKSAVDLSARYLSDRMNPDKSIDVIDEAGAMIQLMPKNKRKNTISKKDIESIVSKLANIPQISVAGTEKDKLKNLKESLLRMIYGQDQAISQVTDAIMLSRAGLGNENRPIANFLFAGPTGVGKTELTKQLALNLGCKLLRFDMSEYMEKHAVSKLIGAPPGYVGHEDGGILTDLVKKHPHSIVLLDEIEKAHADIYNILLQVMDHGVLTDSQGRQTDFKNSVIIMTTNAGSKDMQAGAIGLSEMGAPAISKRDKTIKNFFSPEFRNRLDAVIHFNALEGEYVEKIVEKFIIQLETKLQDKKIELKITDLAKNHLAKEGYDRLMGARPLARIIDQQVKKPLSTEILFGKLENGGVVVIDLDTDGKLVLKYN